MKIAYKAVHIEPDGQYYSFATKGIMKRRFVPGQETVGWGGTPVLVFETMELALKFIDDCRIDGYNYALWRGDIREVVPLRPRYLDAPEEKCSTGKYKHFWTRRTPKAIASAWPAGTVAVRGFTPRTKVWSGVS
jgi:hypothetical protein